MAEEGTAGDFCVSQDVIVDDHQAVWIFSEFETDESLDNLKGWLEPEHWPEWGRPMFEEMKPVGPRTDVPVTDGRQWSANYLEVVNLAGTQLHTVLKCNVKETGNWAAMTYELDHSIHDMLKVDRGYLLAVDVAGRRQVKALKTVGFTDAVLNSWASTACSAWGRWVHDATTRQATGVTATSAGLTGGAVGDTGTPDGGGGAAAAAFTQGLPQQWAKAVSDAANFYSSYASDVGGRMWSADYGRKDAIDDSTRLFLRLARDWSRTWQTGMQMSGSFAEADIPPTGGPGPSAAGGKTLEFTTVLAPPQASRADVTVSDLTRVDLKRATLPSSAITVAPKVVDAGGGATAVRLEADTTSVPEGLYVGALQLASGNHRDAAPALFYVSKARPGA
jgi:hypothetical protein